MTSGSGPAFGERAEYGEHDVCYRHPRVASFTLCQRCGRTVCAECQNASAVGVLCPDCVKATRPGAAKRAARSTRVTGRRLAATDTPVTYGIMIVCVAVFVAQWLSSRAGGSVTTALWYIPLYSLPGDALAPFGYISDFEPWRMLTVMFTHSTGAIFHILFNMYALWLFGRQLEHLLGRATFLSLYLLAGVGGSLGMMFWAYVDPEGLLTPTVGASGAIFGVMAATLVALRAARVNATSLVVMLAINFGIGLLPGANVAWQAHLGGLIVGAATMAVLLRLRGPRKRGQRIVALVVIAAVLVVLSMAYVVQPPDLAALFAPVP